MILPQPLTSSRGFTLIELLVVVAIMTILLSLGVAAYGSFNRSATHDGAFNQLRSNLRLAQAFAINGEKMPGTCNTATHTFNGYYVTFNQSPNSYAIGQYCTDNGTPDLDERRSFALPQQVTIATAPTPRTILFKAVKGVEFYPSATCCTGVPVTSTVTVTVTLDTTSKFLTINSDGKIQ